MLKRITSPLAQILSVCAIFHWFFYILSPKGVKALVKSDIDEMCRRLHKSNKSLMYWLVFYKPYRNLFYYRIPSSRYLRLILPKYALFNISVRNGIGANANVLNHPYCTIINANSIGSYFTVCHLTTIGNKGHGRNDLVPTIGNNVSLGANVTIIGDIKIGNNVIIGAGSVVVKDIPDNCIVAGNPAKIIKRIDPCGS